MKSLARQLRHRSTKAEQQLWRALRNRQIAGAKFRRQHAIGAYIVDFVCLERKLVIEVDGGQHLQQVEHDEKRTAFLESKGLRVLRFWNHDVLQQTTVVLEVICRALTEKTAPSPQPSPPEGERG